jgi:hypothetical protein
MWAEVPGQATALTQEGVGAQASVDSYRVEQNRERRCSEETMCERSRSLLAVDSKHNHECAADGGAGAGSVLSNEE